MLGSKKQGPSTRAGQHSGFPAMCGWDNPLKRESLPTANPNQRVDEASYARLSFVARYAEKVLGAPEVRNLAGAQEVGPGCAPLQGTTR